jgi:hypothetical protein
MFFILADIVYLRKLVETIDEILKVLPENAELSLDGKSWVRITTRQLAKMRVEFRIGE